MQKNKVHKPIKEVGDLENVYFARNVYKKKAIEFQTKLAESHHKMKIFASEIIKRNSKLKSLSEAYNNLEKISHIDKDKISEMQQDIESRDTIIMNLNTAVEKYKKQLIRSNSHFESVYKKLSESESQIRRSMSVNNKLKGELDKITEVLKKKDILLLQKEEQMVKMHGAQKAKIRKEYEEEMAKIWENDKFLKKKLSSLNKLLMEKDKAIIEKDKKLAENIAMQKKIKQFIESAILEPEEEPTVEFPQVSEKKAGKPFFKPKKKIKVEMPPVEEPIEEPAEIEHEEPSFEETLPDTVDEILPMIKVALEHGDPIKTIKSSLISSGYNAKEIDKAIKKVK